MKNKTILYFVRHGKVYNPEYIFYGRLPRFRLSDQGKRQAQFVARELQHDSLTAVFSSPLLRARQTALEIIKYHPLLKLKISGLLTEISTPFEGFPAATVDARRGDVYTGAAPHFERPIDIVNRVQKFIKRARRAFDKRQIAAVTHGDVITFLVLWANGQALTAENKQDMRSWGIPDGYPAPGSLTTLIYQTDWPDERPKISYLRPDGAGDKRME